tara:strand:- start:255 stop:476 length:222 start_codon:yes stop_codon:yes gene_type:complete
MFLHFIKILFTSFIFITISHYSFILLKNQLFKSSDVTINPQGTHINIDSPPVIKKEKINMDDALNEYLNELKT